MEHLAPSLTLANQQRDFVEWRKGRSSFAIWALALDFPALIAASQSYRSHMAAYFLADYVRQPHITLHISGFPSKEMCFADDFPPDEFERQVERQQALELSPFTLEIGSPSSFSSAAYFSVHDATGKLEKIRQALGSRADDAYPYIPHVTFGLYRQQFPMTEVMDQLNAGPPWQPISVEIGKVSLMTYQAAVIGGLLSSQYEFKLNSAPRTQHLNASKLVRCFE